MDVQSRLETPSAARPSPAKTPGSAPSPSPGRRHLDGLDGLRALAVTAVVVYHLDPDWLPGGYLGVDVFFVVSGFLITTLLVREASQHGRVDFGRFWVRRARRLLPALVVCVVVASVVARLVHHDLVVQLGRQVLGAATFSTNWLEISAGSSYFDHTSPVLFMNLWSLAVEEQFYLVWPLAVAAIVAAAVLPSRRVRLGLRVTLVVAVLSTLLMAVLYQPGTDATRVYYGTDTHVFGLMLGAALAFVWTSPARALFAGAGWDRWRRPALGAALGTLGALLWLLAEDAPVAYRGGIALASLATVVLVAGLLPTGRDRSVWTTLMSAAALIWVGRRSYGIYLWHWPVIVIVTQELRTNPGSVQHVVSRLWCVLVILAVADLSYRFVEAPIRVWGFRECIRMARHGIASPLHRTPRLVAAGSAVVLAVSALVVATAPTLSDTQQAIEAADTSSTVAAPPAGRTSPEPAEATAPKATQQSAVPQSWAMPTGQEIDAFGDSLLVTTKGAMAYYFPGVRMDGKSNRWFKDGVAELASRGSDVRRAVVWAFGTNGGIDQAQLDQALDRLGPQRMVVLVNLHVRARFTDPSNALLAKAAAARPNVVVADWESAISGNLALLQSDGTHPTIRGAHLFAKTVRTALAQLSTQHTGQPVALPDLPIP